MSRVTVFVDDAVRGRLPRICVKDGIPTGDSLRFRSEVGDGAGLGVAWLLVLAGPLGWLGLIAISLIKGSGSAETLAIVVPYSEAAYQRRVSARRTRRWAACAAVASAVATLYFGMSLATASPASRAFAVMCAGVFLVALAATVAAWTRLDRCRIGVQLDASRRWVTLSNVHPVFAAAAAADADADHFDRSRR